MTKRYHDKFICPKYQVITRRCDAMQKDTQKYRVAKALYDADEPPTASELKNDLADIPDGSVDSALQNLRKDDYVDRQGEGGRGDPYRHVLTSKGEAAVKTNEEDAPEDAGLGQLFESQSTDAAEPETATSTDGGTKADQSTGDTEDTAAPEPSTGTPTFGDDAFDVTYTNDEAVDVLLALGDADEPDFETRREFARAILREMRQQA